MNLKYVMMGMVEGEDLSVSLLLSTILIGK